MELLDLCKRFDASQKDMEREISNAFFSMILTTFLHSKCALMQDQPIERKMEGEMINDFRERILNEVQQL